MEENSAPVTNPTELVPSPDKTQLYVVIAVVGLVLVVGAYVFMDQIKPKLMPEVAAPVETAMPVPSGPGSTGEAVIEKEAIVEVEKTDAGFSPKSVTVKKGTIVRFVNKSATGMWVASAPHPTHTDYSGFDQKTAGDEYNFTFEKVGSWKYHNHSPFAPGGVVEVTE